MRPQSRTFQRVFWKHAPCAAQRHPFNHLTQLLRGVLLVVGFKFPSLYWNLYFSLFRFCENQWFCSAIFGSTVFLVLGKSSKKKGLSIWFLFARKNLTTTKQSLRRNIHHWLIRCIDRPLLYADGASNLQRSFDFLRCDGRWGVSTESLDDRNG